MRRGGHAGARWQRSVRECRYGLSVSGQRARSEVAADHRSALPRVPGIPWWGAIVLATTASAIGFAYDAGSGDKELSVVFSICYVAGCLLAVLAVRQSALFTAVIQPPLILFGIVPAAYFVFHGGTITGVKDILINCGYPLIERFPLMFFTSATVLLIGLVRWYFASSTRQAEEVEPEAAKRAAGKATAVETTAVEPTTRRRRREHAVDRPNRTTANKVTATAPAAGTSRSRHARPPETELAEPTTSRPRRRPGPPVVPPVEPPPDARRRARAAAPREPRRNPPPVDARGAHERPERRRRPTGYEPYEPYEPFEPRTTKGAGATHHPVSRVRYRGADDGESRTEHRTRPRRPYESGADSWQYDV
jgi:hypothetical protein